jgi:nucleotide-binding universal stress UspA family protein
MRLFIARDGIGEAVLRFAVEHHDDAIVLVRRSRLERGRGAVIREVLESTPCPVLVVGVPAPVAAPA